MRERVGLGEFEVLVLAAVLRLGPGAYGAAVFNEVERTGRPVSLGAVYTTLGRMEEKGLVRSSLGEPTPVRGGRAKKVYELESAGRASLAESVAALAQLLDGTDLGVGLAMGS